MEQNELQPSGTQNTHLANENTSMAIVAYITFIGLIIAFVVNNDKKNPFVSYHIRQALGLMLTALAAYIVTAFIPGFFLSAIVSFVVSIGIIVLWVMGLLNAINRKQKPIPVIGEKFEEWFNK